MVIKSASKHVVVCPFVADREDPCCLGQAGVSKDRCCHACKSCRQTSSCPVHQVGIRILVISTPLRTQKVNRASRIVSWLWVHIMLHWHPVGMKVAMTKIPRYDIRCYERLHMLLVHVNYLLYFTYSWKAKVLCLVIQFFLFVSSQDTPRPSRE